MTRRLNTHLTKHSHRKNGTSPTYQTWQNMIARCHNTKATQYARYGGAGIQVCKEWFDFGRFLADVGERPSLTHSLDRHPDKNGDYEPSNTRWATRPEQARNSSHARPVLRSDGVAFGSMAEAADAVAGNSKSIWGVCNGVRRTHRGYGWSYQ